MSAEVFGTLVPLAVIHLLVGESICVAQYITLQTGTGETTQQLTFVRTNATSLLPFVPHRLIDPGWDNIPSLLACAFTTRSKFNNSKGFLYNVNTKVCTPLLWLTGSGAAGAKEVKDDDGVMYLVDICPSDFQLYEVGTDGTLACLKYDYSGQTYQDATTICNSWGGHLAAVKTFAKLELIRLLANGISMWIGCDDIAYEGWHIWQIDGKNLTTEEITAVFKSGEPNNSGGTEDCVEYRKETNWLNDRPCDSKYGIMCEILLP